MPASPAAEIVTIGGPAYFPAPTMPRKTSVYAPRDPPRQRKKFDLQGSLRRSQTTTHLKSSELSSSTKPMSGLPQISDNLAGDERWRSTSAQTVLSTGSRTQLRPKLPDFGPTARLDSTINTLGLPKPSSMSSSHSMKKQSQFDLIRSARTVPLPPTDERRKPAKSTAPSLVRSSTLYAPTASSLARMQATVKPTSDRPLPVPPTPAVPRFPTSKPFGAASSRNNLLFESNLHNVPKPVHKSISHQTSSRSIASPTKARLRAKASGLSAMKSKGNLRGEVEVQQRRAEIKARQERLAEERGLREMLSGGMSGADMVIS